MNTLFETLFTAFLLILDRERDRAVIFEIFQVVDYDQHERWMPRNVRVRHRNE